MPRQIGQAPDLYRRLLEFFHQVEGQGNGEGRR